MQVVMQVVVHILAEGCFESVSVRGMFSLLCADFVVVIVRLTTRLTVYYGHDCYTPYPKIWKTS